MPPIIHDIEQAAIGCWELVRGNAAGEERFDLSIEGFWRSFGLAFFLAVFDALDALSGHVQVAAEDGGTEHSPVIAVLVVGSIASLITFCAFPLIVGALARPMSLTKRYAPYIIVRNWLTVFLSLPVYLIDALTASGVLPEDLRDPCIVVLVAATFYAGTTIARTVLGTTRTYAFGFALLDFLLALLIGEAASRLIS